MISSCGPPGQLSEMSGELKQHIEIRPSGDEAIWKALLILLCRYEIKLVQLSE